MGVPPRRRRSSRARARAASRRLDARRHGAGARRHHLRRHPGARRVLRPPTRRHASTISVRPPATRLRLRSHRTATSLLLRARRARRAVGGRDAAAPGRHHDRANRDRRRGSTTLIEPALGVRAGGSYDVAVDRSGGHRVFVGLNGGDPEARHLRSRPAGDGAPRVRRLVCSAGLLVAGAPLGAGADGGARHPASPRSTTTARRRCRASPGRVLDRARAARRPVREPVRRRDRGAGARRPAPGSPRSHGRRGRRQRRRVDRSVRRRASPTGPSSSTTSAAPTAPRPTGSCSAGRTGFRRHRVRRAARPDDRRRLRRPRRRRRRRSAVARNAPGRDRGGRDVRVPQRRRPADLDHVARRGAAGPRRRRARLRPTTATSTSVSSTTWPAARGVEPAVREHRRPRLRGCHRARSGCPEASSGSGLGVGDLTLRRMARPGRRWCRTGVFVGGPDGFAEAELPRPEPGRLSGKRTTIAGRGRRRHQPRRAARPRRSVSTSGARSIRVVGAGSPVPQRRRRRAGAVPAARHDRRRPAIPGFVTKAPHVDLADLDNDGLLDLVVSASAAGGEQPIVLRNLGPDGDGVPELEAPPGSTSTQYWVTGATSDFDHDGRLDLVPGRVRSRLSPASRSTNQLAAGHWLAVDASGLPLGGVGAVVEMYEAGLASTTTRAPRPPRGGIAGAGFAAATQPDRAPRPGRAQRSVDLLVRPRVGAWRSDDRVAADGLYRPPTC